MLERQILPFADATSDIAFKKLFGDQGHAHVTISFLNHILDLKPGKRIVAVTIKNGEILPMDRNGKKTYLDIYCSDEQGKEYIVEVQKQDNGNFLPRAQYYVSNSLVKQLQPGDNYRDLKPVIFVGIIVSFEVFETPDFLSHHAIVDLATNKRSLKHSEYHFIELVKFNKQESELVTDADKWIYMLKYAQGLEKVPAVAVESDGLVEAFKVLNQTTWNNDDRMKYREELEVERNLENIEIVIREKALLAVAKRLISQGLSIDGIAAATGLSVEVIEQLKK